MEITDNQRAELVERGRQARGSAYAPYSNYPVGAALLTNSGQIYAGANVENASYPLSMCAERVAVFKAVTNRELKPLAISVVSENGGSPCGACRQVLSEFGLETIVILADGKGNVVRETTVRDLLPHAFGPSDLS
jgi:cytidine deaminase